MKQNSKRLRWGATAGLLAVAAAGLLGACNSHPVEYATATGAVSVYQDRSPDSAAAVDILWVIDNSGSMCEEQAALRENFRDFIDEIGSRNIDFHIGVTTTQMLDSYSPEPVAIPGRLQTVPQPIPTTYSAPGSTTGGCAGNEGDPNVSDDGYQPVRDNIELAIGCTKDPSQWQQLTNVTDEEIACKMGLKRDCAEPADPESLFPTTPAGASPGPETPEADNPYRTFGKFLSAEDYRVNGQLDLERLRDDFSCASLVGTRGFAVEKGLAAAVKAVSPEMTGGTEENPIDESAPNFGFLRDKANFATIFVSDENDCSHDGSLEDAGQCGDDVCEFVNSPTYPDSPLISPQKLATDMVTNLAETKGRNVEKSVDDIRNSVVVASINGNWRRYNEEPASYPEGTAPTDVNALSCDSGLDASIEKKVSCLSSFGSAYSGDRYERFLRQFNQKYVFPDIPDSPDQHAPGLICQPDSIPQTLANIGQTIAGSVSQCIFDVPFECSTTDECPAFYYGDGTSACVPFGNSGKSYCNSGVQVRMYPGKGDSAHTFEELQQHEYCIPDSIDSTMTPGGCVVKRDEYEFQPCPGAETQAVDMIWTDPLYFEKLAGYDVELVYTLLPDNADNGGGADAGTGADTAP